MKKFLMSLCAAAIAVAPVARLARADDVIQVPYYEPVDEQPLTEQELKAAESLGVSREEIFQVRNPMSRDARVKLEREIAADTQNMDRMAARVDAALNKMVAYANWTLKRKGYTMLANQKQAEFDRYYTTAVQDFYHGVSRVDLGDHKPINQWLADFYDKLEARLGVTLCQILHLQDIKILNFGIPVVFKPKASNQWCLETTDKPCIDEYRLHFAGDMKGDWTWYYHGVAGVASYWIVWGVCTFGTMGGGVLFLCGIVGTAAEIGIDKYVAPKASDWIYGRFNQ